MTITPINHVELKPLTPTNYEAYFALRLESLKTYPQMYASNAQDWAEASREVVEKHLEASERGESPIIGAWVDQELVGLVGIKPEFRPTVKHKATLWGLYVVRDHRCQGIGSKLLAGAVSTAKGMEAVQQLRAVVNTSSAEAVHLFQRAGFEQFGLEPRAKFVHGVYQDQAYFWYPLNNEEN